MFSFFSSAWWWGLLPLQVIASLGGAVYDLPFRGLTRDLRPAAGLVWLFFFLGGTGLTWWLVSWQGAVAVIVLHSCILVPVAAKIIRRYAL